MVREILKIRTDNGLGNNNPTFKDIMLTEYSAKFPRMGMPSLSATLKWATPLDNEWTRKEYVELRGERFYIRHTPSGKKDNQDARYSHEIEFTSEFAEILGNTYFVDAVPDLASGVICQTRNKPCSNNTKFTFYGTISEFVDRLNCAFRYANIGDSALNVKTSLTTADSVSGNGYCAMLDPYGDYDREKTYEFSFEDKYLWEAITYGHETTEIPFERRGKKIIFGAVPVTVKDKFDNDYVFEYGHDSELLSIYHKNANVKVINRITMQGSSENIPYYYPNETEYGHIDTMVHPSNSVLTSNSMIEIVNMSQLLATLRVGEFAVLRGGSDGGDTVEIDNTSFKYSFGDGLTENYNLGTALMHAPKGTADYNIPWHISFSFSINKESNYIIDSIVGNIWTQDSAYPTEARSMLNGAKPENLSLTSGGLDLVEQVKITEKGIELGSLPEGNYTFRFSLPIPNRSGGRGAPIYASCRINSLTVVESVATEKKGYYWSVGTKSYGLGGLGVRLSAEPSEAMVGDMIGWNGSALVPFQDHLMPPKYRNTNGAERFYNALDNTYTDPDTGGNYIFPNPYIEGAPSEHIHSNEEIKPTIEGVKNTDGKLFGVIADIAYDYDDNDSLKIDSTEDADKNDSLKYEHSFFYIKLNTFNGEYGFDLFKHASQSDPMTIQMTSGSCNGCKFKIQAVEFTDSSGLKSYKNPVQTTIGGDIVPGTYKDKVSDTEFQDWQQDSSTGSIWICVQKDADTFGVIMPNQSNNFKPAIGDKFNIINIDLPQGYILAAEKRLEDEGIRFMADNNEEKFTFDIQASRIFLAEHPEVLSQLDEYSIIKVKYNGKTYGQYVNQLTIDCKDSEALPNIGIDLTDTLAVGESFIEQVAERASSLIANASTMGGGLGGVPVRILDNRYLRKDVDDRTPNKVASDLGFEVGKYTSGSSGGIFYQDPETGRTYLETDELRVRMKAIFEELVISKVTSISGKQIITPGGSIDISYVEDVPAKGDYKGAYRCYFKAKENDKGGECMFVVGDQVQCQEFNIGAGTHQNAGNRFYWRLVTAVNNEGSYIELSKTDCASGSDAPQIGDTVCQLGNRTNVSRRSAIVFSTVDAFAPCITLYNGIGYPNAEDVGELVVGSPAYLAKCYSLDKKSVVEYGVDKTKNPPEPFFNCYGRMFVGPRDRSSYLEFTPADKKLVFKGELDVKSTINGKDFLEFIKENSGVSEDLEDFINNALKGLQDQIDGVVETWFYNGVPTLESYPANIWAAEDEANGNDNIKIQHLGDLYYDNDTGTAYRFSQDAQGNYFWNVITDDAITKALAAAQKAQDTADGKRRIFTAQPYPPYDQGDMWVNATYPPDYDNDILRCLNAKATGESFSINDWGLASNYTDDSALNEFISEYRETVENIKTQVDGKAETWYQAEDPSLGWTTDEDKAMHLGDLWYNTTDGTTWYWDGAQWKQQDIPTSVFDAIDGKADIFVSKPTGGYHVNDLWFLEAEYTLSDGKHQKGTLAVALRDMGASWSANDWAKKDRYTDDTLAQEALDRFDAWAADGVFSPSEMKELRMEIERINGDKSSLDQRFEAYYDPDNPDANLLAAKTAYSSAHASYLAAINAVLNAVPDADGCVAVPSDFKPKMQNYYNVRAQYEYMITLAQKAYADSVAAQYEYLKTALAQDTKIAGGLIMTTLISLGVTDTDGVRHTWAGMNGGYLQSLGGRTIASWWGGEMIDRFNSSNQPILPVPTNAASALVRMDGSGYLAKGNILWNNDGSGSVAGGNITWDALGAVTVGTGVKFDVTNVNGLADTLSSLSSFVNGLNNLFVAVENDAARTEHDIAWASITANKSKLFAIKAKVGFYSNEFISARGLNPDGSGGGSGSSGATALGYLTDVTISNPQNGQFLVYNGSKWVNQAVSLPSLSDYALKSDLTAHTGNSAIHVTAAEKTLWNQTATNLSSIMGADSDTIINKWEEVVAFLATYTEADTLANLLSNKADKTQLADYLKVDGTNGTASGVSALINKLSTGSSTPSDADYYVSQYVGGGTTTTSYHRRPMSALWNYIKGKADSVYVNTTGDTMSGDLLFSDSGTTTRQVRFTVGTNDYGRIAAGATAANAGWVEIASADDGNEPVYARQYTGAFTTIKRTATLLDASGNTSFPNQVTVGSLKIGDCVISWDSTKGGLKFSKGIYSESFVSAHGGNASGGSSSGGSSGGASYNRLDNWSDYTTDKTGYVLSAKLGYDLYNNKADKTWVEGKGYLTNITKAQVESVLTGNITSHEHGYIRGGDTSNITSAISGNYGFGYFRGQSSTAGIFPTQNNANGWLTIHTHQGNYYHQLGFSSNGYLYHRSFIGAPLDTTTAWNVILTSANIGSYAITEHQSLTKYMDFARGNVDPNTITKISVREVEDSAHTNAPTTNAWHQYMTWGTGDSNYAFQFANKYSVSGSLYFRQKIVNSWGVWKTVLDSVNYPNHVTTLRDRTNGTATYLNYGAAGISNPSWLAAWNGYELRAISPANVLACIGALPLTGGTLTGNLTINGSSSDTPLKIKSVDANGCYIQLSSNAETLGYYGAKASGPVWFKEGASQTIWHQGNDGSGSGLDADLLDGLHNGEVTAKLMTYNNDANISYRVQFMQKSSGWNAWEAPSQAWYSVMKLNHGDGDTYYSRVLAFDFLSDRIYTHRKQAGSDYGWNTLAFTNDVTIGYLKFGGPNRAGLLGPADLIDGVSLGNKFEALPASYISIERWNGSAWVDAGYSNADKTKLVSNCGSDIVPSLNNSYQGNKLRVTITAANGVMYFIIHKLCINFSREGSGSCRVLVERSRIESDTTYETVGTYSIDGWSGWNSIYFSPFAFGGSNSQTNQTRRIRLTFISDAVTGTYATNKIHVYNILAYGITAWSTANTMNKYNRPYVYDVTNGDATFVGNIKTSPANGSAIQCNGTSHTWGLHMGTGGENRGIYEWTEGYNKWLLYFTNSNTILNHGYVGVNNTSPSYQFDVTGTARVTKLIVSATDAASHLGFSRGSYNYVTAPTSGLLAFVSNGKAVGEANSDLIVENNCIRPGSDITANVGKSDRRWNKVYAQYGFFSTTGTFNENAPVSTTLFGGGRMELYHATPFIDFHFGNSSADYTTRLIEEASGRLAIIGTLRVSAGMYSNGYVSARGQNTSSDENLKFLERKFVMDVKKIANAPSWFFKWKSDGKEDVGSLAQYWQRINPLLTPKMNDGYLTLQYGKTALLGLISVAKKVVSHEEEIRQLKEEVKRLKKKIAQLERR